MLIALATLVAAPAAWALSSDSKQPIQISADRFDGDMGSPNGTGTYAGNVVITQGSIRITADVATVHMQDGVVKSALITGTPAHFQQQPDGDAALTQGWARRIDYDADKDTVDLRTDARVIQDGRQMSADTIHYNTAAEKVLADSKQKADTRVHIVIPPKQTEPAKAPPAPAKTGTEDKAGGGG